MSRVLHVGEERRIEERVAQLAQAMTNLLEQRLAVDRVRQRAAHAHVLERRVAQVEVDVVVGVDDGRHRRVARDRLDAVERRGGQVPGEVELVRLQLRRQRVLVRDDLVDDLGDLRLAQKVVGVGCEPHLIAALPRDELVRAAADRGRVVGRRVEAALVVVELREQMLRHDRPVAVQAPELLQERRVHVLEVDDGDVRVAAVDVFDLSPAVGRDDVVLRVHHHVPGEAQVAARELHAVVPLDPVPQLVVDREPVFADVAVLDGRDLADGVGDRLRVIVVAHGVREQERRQLQHRARRGQRRVQVLRIGGRRHHDAVGVRAGVAGRAAAAGRVADLRARRKSEREKRARGEGTAYHERIASGSRSCSVQNARYAAGAISEGLISLRPPQNTLV